MWNSMINSALKNHQLSVVILTSKSSACVLFFAIVFITNFFFSFYFMQITHKLKFILETSDNSGKIKV